MPVPAFPAVRTLGLKTVISWLAWLTGGDHDSKENKMRSATQEQCLEDKRGLAMVVLSIVSDHYPLEESKVLSHVT